MGEALGRGQPLAQIIAGMHGMVAEGVLTANAALGLARKHQVEMPITEQMYAILHDGKSPHDAIHEACRLRFRPILMTTLCALLAGVPLMLGTGTGSEIRQPLGYAMVGGLLVSQLLTLFTTPVVYLYLDKVDHLLSRRLHPPALVLREEHGPAIAAE